MRTGKRSTSFFLLLVILLILSVSCQAPEPDLEGQIPAEDRGLGDVMAVMDIDKRVTVDTDNKIKYWEFMATPLFTLAPDEGEIYGRVDYWRRLSAITTPEGAPPAKEGTLGKYMSGNWYFELRALNKNGHVVAVGSTKSIVREGLENVIRITLYPDSADGTHGESADDTSRRTGVTGSKSLGQVTTERYGVLHLGFLVNRLEEDDVDMDIDLLLRKTEKVTGRFMPEQNVDVAWKYSTEGEAFPIWSGHNGNVPAGKIWIEGSIALDAGVYSGTLKLQARNKSGVWTVLGGQGFDAVMIGGEETAVRGFLTAGGYVVSGIKIAVPGTIYGTINGHGSEVSVNGKAVTLSWNQSAKDKENSQETAIGFDWYFEGRKLDDHSSSITVTCPVDADGRVHYGVYRISLCPIGSAGSKGHTDIDVIFNPLENPDASNHDWETNRTHEVVFDSIYDIDPSVTGNQIVIGFVEGDGNPIVWSAGKKMISYPYRTRVKTLRSLQTARDAGLSPVYVTTAGDLDKSKAVAAWFGPSATLGASSNQRLSSLRSIRFVPNATEVKSDAAPALSAIENIFMHDRIRKIGDGAFKGCGTITEITVPAATVGREVFAGCKELETITFKTGAVIDGAAGMAEGSTALCHVTLPSSGSAKLPERGFKGCTVLEGIDIPSVFSTVGPSAFENSGIKAFKSSSITTISVSAFKNGKALDYVDIPKATTIGQDAFSSCTALHGIVMDSLKNMGTGAFAGCTLLNFADIPGTLATVPANAFSGCTNLSAVNLHRGTTSIGSGAFRNTGKLNSIIIPAGLTGIASDAFTGSGALIIH